MLFETIYWEFLRMRMWFVKGMLGILFSSLLWAADFWNQKPYTQWNWHEINRLLGDSPWAAQQAFGETVTPAEKSSVEQDRPSSDAAVRGVREELSVPPIVTRQYFIRFQSATPVRMALAQRAVLEGRITPEQAADYVEMHPAPGYVVAAILVPRNQDRAELNLVSTEYLRSRAYLRLKSSKKQIYLEKYRSPSEMGGWEAYLYFPRFSSGEDLFQLEEEEVTFVCELNSETRLSRRFSLENMVFRGELEI